MTTATGSLVLCPAGCRHGWVRVPDGPEDTAPDLCNTCGGKGMIARPFTEGQSWEFYEDQKLTSSSP